MDQLDRNGASHLSTSLKVMNLLVQQKVWSLYSYVNENWKVFIVLDVGGHLFGVVLIGACPQHAGIEVCAHMPG